MPGAGNAPVEATIFAYQVGFGDCFLLRFTYEDQTSKHILIDCGTTGLPADVASSQLLVVAKDIADKCDGKLDIVVATHRHADHISGFATKADGKGSGDVLKALKPELVLQPWTEAPDAPLDSLGPDPVDGAKAFTARKNTLAAMHAVSAQVVAHIDQRQFQRMPALAGQLRFIGEDNLANLSAVHNLQDMGDAGTSVYCFHGCDPKTDAVLPGVKVHVLGPPTLHQTDTIRKQRSRDKDEFWQLAPKQIGEAMGPVADQSLFPDAPYDPASKLLTEQRWIAERIDTANAEQLLGLVRSLDDQMNNTSLILLFEAGSKSLLFPGDAQLENWEYALQSPFADLLADVDVYKVGHHGSLNATPKSMWNKLANRGPKSKPGRLTSVMSTMAGKHGNEHSHTEVPRKTLVDALRAETDLRSTADLATNALYDEITIDLR